MDVSEAGTRLDRMPVTALHLLAMSLCACGFAFDTLEIALGGILAAVFSTPPHVIPASQLSLLLGSVYIGAAIGAPALGWVADRCGRRITLMGLLLWLGLCSLAGAASETSTGLTLSRVLGGLAMGAYPPIVIAYLTDLLPPARRGMLIFVVVAFATLGPPIGIFLVRFLTPLQPLGIEAWRWGFVFGGLGTALVGALFWFLPESPRWLQARGRTTEADAVCRAFEQSRVVLPAQAPRTKALFPSDTPGPPVSPMSNPGKRDRAIIGAVFLLSPWATVAFPLLTGAVLTQKGFKLSDTLLILGLSWFGPLLGTLLASISIDRFDRRAALCLWAAAMTLAGAVFVAGNAPSGLLAASVTFSLFASLYVPTLTMYGAEMFPTHTRARSVAAAWALNRVGAAGAPFLLLPLLHSAGAIAMFSVIAFTLIGSMLLLIVAPRGAQRRSVL